MTRDLSTDDVVLHFIVAFHRNLSNGLAPWAAYKGALMQLPQPAADWFRNSINAATTTAGYADLLRQAAIDLDKPILRTAALAMVNEVTDDASIARQLDDFICLGKHQTD